MTEKKLKMITPERVAVASALLGGGITHLFALVNVTFNYDNVTQIPGGLGTGAPSGRWFLQILKDLLHWLGFDYNLPTVNGIIFILFIALSAGFFVSAFHVRSNVSAGLLGLMFIVFPTAASNLFFRFAAGVNGLAVLLAVVSAWLLTRPYQCRLPLSVLCATLSLGIYQANITLTISMLLLLLIQQALEDGAKPGEILRRGLYYCGALILSVGLYFLLTKVFMKIYQVELLSYQGINEMGRLSLSELPGLVKAAYKGVLLLPFQDYYGVAPIGAVRILMLLLGLLSGALLLLIFRRKAKSPVMVALTLGLCMLFPLAVNFIVIMASKGFIYTLMLYSFVMLPCVPLVLAEQLPEGTGRPCRRSVEKGLAVVLSLLIFAYGYYDNVNYAAMHHSTKQMEHYANALVAQVRMTDGFRSDMRWAFVGETISDPMMRFAWKTGVTYGGNSMPQNLINAYSRWAWFNNILGYRIRFADEAELAELAALEDVQAMPVWPDQGSIQIIDGVVVIKCQELGPNEES